MKTRTICLTLLFLLSSLAWAADDAESMKQKFIGDYELVSYFTFPASGGQRDMNYIGRLSYDALGNMAGLGMPRDLPQRAENSSERTIGGFAYWGLFSVDVEKQIVLHHVKGSPMVPRWVDGGLGTDLLEGALRNQTTLGLHLADRELHLEPAPVAAVLGPDLLHLRTRVAVDHQPTFSQT